MQWLIEIVKAWLWLYLKGMVILWTEALEDIPDGWHLCDGTNGTPDLRNWFVTAAGPDRPPNITGGTDAHKHHLFCDSHHHNFGPGDEIAAGEDITDRTNPHVLTGEIDRLVMVPPYCAAYYIIKL